MEQIESYFADKEKFLEKVYAESKLQHSPDEAKIKQLLFNCLETHFGSLQGAVNKDVSVTTLISELQSVISRYEGK